MNLSDIVEPIVPPCWEAVFSKYVLAVGGPMSGNVVPWYPGVDRLVLAAESAGCYVLSEKQHFAVWKENGNADHNR